MLLSVLLLVLRYSSGTFGKRCALVVILCVSLYIMYTLPGEGLTLHSRLSIAFAKQHSAFTLRWVLLSRLRHPQKHLFFVTMINEQFVTSLTEIKQQILYYPQTRGQYLSVITHVKTSE